MPKVKDFYDFLNSRFPFSTQESWDNSGMLVGDENAEVSRAAVVLDITDEAIKYAQTVGANLIISHHPVIFRPQKKVLAGSLVYSLAQAGISAIGAHTCLDCGDGGVNDVLAEILGLENIEIFPCSESERMVRAGILPEPMSAKEMAAHIKSVLGGRVLYCDCGKKIESVAVCGGAGNDFAGEVVSAGIDAFITGEADHHNFLDAKQAGLNLFAAGHFETENPIVTVLANILRLEFEDTDIVVIPQSSPVLTE
ncbi:MAG: Nif3-like dinuclear metal center hexameric protein [Clostridia bacterium]|nr:Nif3-like dinuclear metal center hexameric protein [Clostridia bacterium]